MALIPSMLLRQLYTFGSLKNADHGVQFSIKNRLSDAEFTELQSIRINGSAVPLDAISIDLGDGVGLPLDRISASHPIAFPLRQTLIVRAGIAWRSADAEVMRVSNCPSRSLMVTSS